MADYLTTKQVQNKLHLSRPSVYKLYKIRGFPVYKIGNKYLVDEDKLERFLEDRKLIF